ncbi:hypothetical protein [Altererythrobacter sp. Root672]|uniref:hypothetical protein n=1 Tax=Altererythrobacter sp. Root672 TaxID=1736584 RepID=UPI000A86B832|nr:hypothetical protein [Altererythrobacter sp. Root672]
MLNRWWLASALAAVVLVGTAMVLWYQIDRTTMLKSMCEVGLPNFSRPNEIDADRLGCAIVGPKRTFSGVLVTGFEASNFQSPDFPSVPGQQNSEDKRAWFNCPRTGCGNEFDAQLGHNYVDCPGDDSLLHRGLASIEAEGWVTVSEGAFGHLGSYPREFFASRIVRVSPPPQRMVDEWMSVHERYDECDGVPFT